MKELELIEDECKLAQSHDCGMGLNVVMPK